MINAATIPPANMAATASHDIPTKREAPDIPWPLQNK